MDDYASRSEGTPKSRFERVLQSYRRVASSKSMTQLSNCLKVGETGIRELYKIRRPYGEEIAPRETKSRIYKVLRNTENSSLPHKSTMYKIVSEEILILMAPVVDLAEYPSVCSNGVWVYYSLVPSPPRPLS